LAAGRSRLVDGEEAVAPWESLTYTTSLTRVVRSEARVGGSSSGRRPHRPAGRRAISPTLEPSRQALPRRRACVWCQPAPLPSGEERAGADAIEPCPATRPADAGPEHLGAWGERRRAIVCQRGDASDRERSRCP